MRSDEQDKGKKKGGKEAVMREQRKNKSARRKSFTGTGTEILV